MTEFLPVSSSAHLVYFQKIFGLTEAGPVLAFDVALHLGTLAAVVFAFRLDLLSMVRDTLRWVLRPSRGASAQWPGARFTYLLFWATLPAVVVALGFKHEIEEMFVSSASAAWGLIVTGVILMLTKWLSRKSLQQKRLTVGDAFWVGCAQAIAIQPGISRSGSTIAAGLFLGFDQTQAARFSFLMSIPAILGSVVFEAKELSDLGGLHMTPIVVGVVVSAITGFLSIRFLLRVVQSGRLHLFAYYCWVAGLLGLWFF